MSESPSKLQILEYLIDHAHTKMLLEQEADPNAVHAEFESLITFLYDLLHQ